MSNHELGQFLFLLISWAIGSGVLFLWLKNKDKSIEFKDISSSFFLGIAVGAVAAFAGGKANIGFWLTWIIYAAAGGYVTYRFLNKKEPAAKAEGAYGASLRPGSMAAAEAKEEKTFLIVATVVFSLCYLLWIVPSNLYTHGYFVNAGLVWRALGFASIAVHYWFIWKKMRGLVFNERDVTTPGILLIGWFGLNLLLLSGFTFDLPR